MLTLVPDGIVIAVGVFCIVIALQLRAAVGGRYWSMLTRLASTVLGGMTIAQWPASGLWAIGLFLTIELLFNG